MSKEECIEIVEKMRKQYYDIPLGKCYSIHDVMFKFESYIRWSVSEILNFLENSEEENPLTLLEKFRWEMDQYACQANGDDANLMFSTAYDVATDILDTLITYGGR